MSDGGEVEQRDFIDPSEAERHIFGEGCPCAPDRIDVTLETGPGIAWKHHHLEPPEDEVPA